MKKYIIVNISCAFLFLILILNSCSKENDEVVVPVYLGTWERKWIDKEAEVQYIQTLEIKNDRFISTIETEKDNIINKYLEFEGKQIVIDMTFEAWIEKISKAGPDNEVIYIDKSYNDFNNIVFETLNIHSNFIGFYTINNDVLNLALDFNGDSIAGGNEGSINFKRIESSY